MKKTLIILGALIVVVYIVMTAFVAVHVTETVVITHFGKPIRVLDEAGLTFKLPDPVQTAIRLDKRLQPLDSNIGEYLTHDKKNLVVSNFVLWRIIDAKKFIQSVKDVPSAERRLSAHFTLKRSEAMRSVRRRMSANSLRAMQPTRVRATAICWRSVDRCKLRRAKSARVLRPVRATERRKPATIWLQCPSGE